MASLLAALVPLRCAVCDAPGAALCRRCERALPRATPAAPVPAVDRLVTFLRYDAAAARLVAALKYRDRRAVLTWVAAELARLLVPEPGAVVTWAPTSARRRRARGFDQAELLARALAARWNLPSVALLQRLRGPPQTGRSARERRVPAGFTARGRAPASVVLVDDVATTGATLTCAARELRRAGAISVVAVTVARTPLKVPPATAEHSP